MPTKAQGLCRSLLMGGSLVVQVKQLLDEVERVKALEASRRREAELLQGSEAALLAKGALYRQAITVLVRPAFLQQESPSRVGGSASARVMMRWGVRYTVALHKAWSPGRVHLPFVLACRSHVLDDALCTQCKPTTTNLLRCLCPVLGICTAAPWPTFLAIPASEHLHSSPLAHLPCHTCI